MNLNFSSLYLINNLFTKKQLLLLAIIAFFSVGSFAQNDPDCSADTGNLNSTSICIQGTEASISAIAEGNAIIPDGFQVIYVLTSGDELVIQAVSNAPKFIVEASGSYTIHTLVYDPATLDLSIVEFGVTTGVDVNNLLIQGGGTICAALDVAGSKFEFDSCEAAFCLADFGSITPDEACLEDSIAQLNATIVNAPVVPDGFQVLYVLTSGEGLVIEAVSETPSFEVNENGLYTIHTLVYDPNTLDLGIVEFGTTTGVDVNGLLIQGGGDICGALDVAGASFNIEACPCPAMAGTLFANNDESSPICLEGATVAISASIDEAPTVPEGFQVLYVLTSGENLVIEAVGDEPSFEIDTIGRYTIHTLVFDPNTLDLSIVEFGVTTGVDVNGLLEQGGGDICGALDVAGAAFDIEICTCEAGAGTLTAINDPANPVCLEGEEITISAEINEAPTVPEGFNVLYVLTSGEGLVIEAVNENPTFSITNEGVFTIHTLVYDPNTLDLGIVEFGVTTGVDVNGLLEQGGGDICGALDVAGAAFDIEICTCEAEAGTLTAINDPANPVCLEGEEITISAEINEGPTVPEGFNVLYVLTSGEGLVIEAVNENPTFSITNEGVFTIHTLVYDPNTLDLGIVEFGVTTGVDVNGLLEQGGGDICGALDVAGAAFDIALCDCTANAGTLSADPNTCLIDGTATLIASIDQDPTVPEGFNLLYVLTSGNDLVIQAVSESPTFEVSDTGRFTIHTLVYDPATLDLGIVEIGVTTGVDVNNLLIQGGGDICAALDVNGAPFELSDCSCQAQAGSLGAGSNACLLNGIAKLSAFSTEHPVVPHGFKVLYVLTQGDELIIRNIAEIPFFRISETGIFRIHRLVYDPNTISLSVIQFGTTTGFDVNSLLIQGGGAICASLDVEGALFDVAECEDVCDLDTGILKAVDNNPCLIGGSGYVEAKRLTDPFAPGGFDVLYVLTKGEDLVIQSVSQDPKFEVSEAGLFTIHTLIYDPSTLDLSIVELGVTTGFDVNSLLTQGGGDICAALDVEGVPFHVQICQCKADAGTLNADEAEVCLNNGVAKLKANNDKHPIVPSGFEVIYVLTSGNNLIIENVSGAPTFEVSMEGKYTIHTLVYDPKTLDLGIVELGVTTGFDVNGLLIQGGGDICAALDVPGASFTVDACETHIVNNGTYQIMPNPTKNQLNINFSDAAKVNQINLEIINLNGFNIVDIEFEGGQQVKQIDISTVPAGIYTVIVKYDGKPQIIRKLIKHE